MLTFNQSLLRLIEQGIISEEIALEKATNPEQLQMNLNGVFLSAGAIIG
jgi:Tfp pilus assembly pilus retraction ATPase PilT